MRILRKYEKLGFAVQAQGGYTYYDIPQFINLSFLSIIPIGIFLSRKY